MTLLDLTRDLVRAPSQAGIDSYGPVVDILSDWLRAAGLTPRVLSDGLGPVGVVVDIVGTRPGPHVVLDACLDTAPVGDTSTWSVDPFGAAVREGWLYGRGAADSKAAVAVFAHLAAELAATGEHPGRLTVLADLDEHTGGFGGIRRYLEEAHPDMVMIGYPGDARIVTGGRGVWRARITVHGQAGHSGSSKPGDGNALLRAARLVELLHAIPLDIDPGLGMPGKVTPTSLAAGTPGGFSIVPGVAILEVDVRLVPSFTAADARKLIQDAAATLDEMSPGLRPTSIEQAGETWPPFLLPTRHPMVEALRAGAQAVGWSPTPGPAGPSNIGCLLASWSIPATAGFGVRHRGLHGVDEAIEVASLSRVQSAYGHAVGVLLNLSDDQLRASALAH